MQVLDLLIFRQPGLAIDAKAAAIFTLLLVLKGRCAQNYKKIDLKNYQKMNVRNHNNTVPFFL